MTLPVPQRIAPIGPHWSVQSLWPAFLVLTIGLMVTFMLWRMEQADEDHLALARFEGRVHEIQNSIQSRMISYEQILRGGVSLFATLGNVTREQWATYVKQLDVETNFPGIHGMGYAQAVPLASKETFEQSLRAQGLPNYRIRPLGDRPEYSPVTFLEPRTDRNLNAHGFDMLSDPTRRTAMQKARDTGLPAITGKLKLAAEPNQSPIFGFLIYLPVYRAGMPLTTVEERRMALQGYINSPFRINDFLHGLLGSSNDHINLSIYDGNTVSTDTKMYDEQERGTRGTEGPATWFDAVWSMAVTPRMAEVSTTLLPMMIHDHAWTLALTPLPELNKRDNATATVVLLSGSAISLLLSALAAALVARVRLIKHSESHYFQLANFDSLTGLPNRAMFHDRLERNLHQAQRDKSDLAVMFLDLDHFKAVNDRLGHHIGDALLKEVAQRILSCLRKVDTVARLGGDEFTIILTGLKSPQDAGKVAQNILTRLSEPFQLSLGPSLPVETIQTSASAGITLFPADGSDSATLLKNADQAMYAAKNLGRNRFQYFSPELKAAA